MKKSTLTVIVIALVVFTNIVLADKVIQNLSSNAKIPSAQLGGGYSNDRSEPTPIVCLADNPPTIGGSNKGVLDLARAYDLSSVKDQLNFRVKGEVGIGAFSSSVAADFMHFVSEDAYSESLIYRTTLEFKDKSYHLPSGNPLSPDGEQYKNNPDLFRERCGDTYIAQMHHGASLYVALQFQFLTKEDKTHFNSSFSGDFGNLAKLSAELSRKIEKSNIKGNIHIAAFQTGGDPQLLATIFQNPDPTQPSPFSQCSLSNLVSCNKVLDGVVKYISSPTEGFPAQFPPTEGIPRNAAETSFETYPYPPGIVPGKSKLNRSIIDARNALGTMLEKQQTWLLRAQYLKQQNQQYPFVYDEFNQRLATVIQQLETNIELLRNAGLLCFEDLDNCIPMKEKAMNDLYPVEGKDIAEPDTIVFNEINPPSIFDNLFVARENNVPGTVEKFLGIVTEPKSDAHYRIDVQIIGNKIYMTKREDESPYKVVAEYQGMAGDKSTYTGSVTYPNSHVVGRWSGKLIRSEKEE